MSIRHACWLSMVFFFVLSALLKQQGMGVKGAAKSTPVIEEIPPLLEGGGKMEVILSIFWINFLGQMK